MTITADFVAALNRGDGQSALGHARAMLAGDLPLGNSWRAVAQFARHRREWTVATAAIARFAAADPTDLERLLVQAEILVEAGGVRAAADLVAPLSAKNPGDARLHHFMGTALAQLGETNDAVNHLAAATRLLPGSGPSWLALANAHRFHDGDPLLGKLLDARDGFGRAAPEQHAAYLYAVGKAHDDLGDVDAAFTAFRDGAALARAARPFDAAVDRAQVRTLLGALDGARSSAPMTFDAPSRAILVTGLPRSGTTLVEQMLTSHSAVADGGELNLLAQAAADFARPAGDISDPASIGAIRSGYHHLLDERFGQDGRIVDKSLNTGRLAGLVRTVLADAPLLWLRRDPLDTALSCFRTYFASGLPWSFALDDIACHFATEDLLFERLRAVLGERMLVIPYAELVDEPGVWIPRLLHHAGLPIEQEVFAFHATPRAVATSSVAQVRRPLYRDAVGAAGRYAKHLAPFEERYARERAALGFS